MDWLGLKQGRLGGISVALLLLAPFLRAQTPSPSASPSPAPAASASAAPSIDTQTSTGQLINALTPADLQAAFGLIKSNFAQPGVINETEMNRATLQGLMTRLGHGLLLLPDKATSPSAAPNVPFYGEILEDHIGYLRPGSLSNASLQATDKKLIEFASKKTDGLVIDLRGSSTDDFNLAAEL